MIFVNNNNNFKRKIEKNNNKKPQKQTNIMLHNPYNVGNGVRLMMDTELISQGPRIQGGNGPDGTASKQVVLQCEALQGIQ